MALSIYRKGKYLIMRNSHSLNIFSEWSLSINREINKKFSWLKTHGALNEHPFIHHVYEWTQHYLENSGKRMHGISIILAYKACSGKLHNNVLKIAAAFQLYHHYTLVHDDIYDEDVMRRGWPTTHEYFSQWFAKKIKPDDAEGLSRLFLNDYKRRGAITAFAYGKIIRAMAFSLIDDAGFSKEKTLEILNLLNHHDIFDSAAQLKDIYHEKNNAYDAKDCLDNAWIKTGRYFEIVSHVGGLLADSSFSQIAALKLWAGNSGLAYQIKDDLEDIALDSEKGQGRGVGGDIIYRKPTYLYALAKAITSGQDNETLLAWENHSEPSDVNLNTIIELLNKSGATSICQEKVNQLIKESHQELVKTKPEFSLVYSTLMREFSEYFISAKYWKRIIKYSPTVKFDTLSKKDKYFKYFIFDLHGVLLGKSYPSTTSTPGKIIGELAEKGAEVFYLTNSSSMHVDDIIFELRKLNIPVEKEQIITAGMIMGHYIAKHFKQQNVYLIGSTVLKETIEQYCRGSIEWCEGHEANIVVVSRDIALSETQISSVKAAAMNNAALLATCRDQNFPRESGIETGPGSTVEKIEFEMKQQAYVVGKPNPYALIHLIGLTDTQLKKTLIIGDSLTQDIQLGIDNHCATALILSQNDNCMNDEIISDYQFIHLENINSLVVKEDVCV
jgi:geranylgeranyl diphosphate synthase type I